MKKVLQRLMLYSVLIAGALLFTIPLLWMLSTALKPIDQAMSSPPRWLAYQQRMIVDGQSVSVGVGDLPEDAGPDSPITVSIAYQWVLDVNGESVPVKRVDRDIDLKDDTLVTVSANYHLYVQHGGAWRPARIKEPNDASTPDKAVEVVLADDEDYMLKARVSQSQIRKTYDKTIEEVNSTFGQSERLVVSSDRLSRIVVPWESRTELSHVFVEQQEAVAGDLDTRVSFLWGNFGKAISAMKIFPFYLKNTVTLCILTVIGAVCSSTLVAYGFSRIDWPGRDKVFLVVMATMMIPFPVLMVPLFTMFRNVGWIGTLKPLWVPTLFAGAFNIFLLRQFFRTIPKGLSESAKIDGCSEFRIFWQIILPLARPAITVVALFQFMGTWNDFLGPLIYLTDQKDFTLALGLQFFQSQQGGTQWHYLMAASCLIVLPVIVLFFLAQKTFIEGISMSGLKG